MKRREFLQGALAVAAVALLPKAVPQTPLAALPTLSWSEEAGRRLMDGLQAGLYQKTIAIPASSQMGEIFWSDDGGTTWKPMGSEDAGWFSFSELGDTWGVYDPDTGLVL